MKFQMFVKRLFVELRSANTLKITIGHRANWWLGNMDSPYFKLAEKVIEQEWNVKPLRIREGGSLPAVGWCQSYFNAPVIHIPMGQASDNAHLPNERIRMQNLMAGQRVMKNFLEEVGKI